jgi:serine phosphatase RsbU (regulator of sigma subunit)/pSer/pThr/pTyr-binding forkhead associated (FHA) protein
MSTNTNQQAEGKREHRLNGLRFYVISGPEMPVIEIEGGGSAVIGRSADSDIRLAAPTVSRQHATVEYSGDHWTIHDHGGTNGTFLNDVRLDSNTISLLAEGDRLQIGPWTLQVGTMEATTVSMPTSPDEQEVEERVQRIDPSDVAALARHRLSLFIECAGLINQASNEEEQAQAILSSAIEGTGFGRAALLRPKDGGDQVEVLNYRIRASSESDDTGFTTFSRSLIRAASEGDMVSLLSDSQPDYGQSIADLNIHSALCCPIEVDDAIAAILYLDARGEEATVQADATGFCQALVRIAGLAIANLRRRELLDRQQRLESDLAAAREAQQFIVPSTGGRIGAFDYSVLFRPGRYASGDLFDIFELEDGRVVMCLGDVSGKGIGAAILMAASQSYLHGALLHYDDPGKAVAALNDYISDRSATNRFISLWVGVFNPIDGNVVYVDAGHGHWVHAKGDGTCSSPERADHQPVGIIGGTEFTTSQLHCQPGDRVLVMTDGVVEQPGADNNEQYGIERVHALLSTLSSPEEDVKQLVAAVFEYADTDELADDTTVTSIGLAQA